MKVKVFAGKWDSWGIEASFCPYTKGLTLALLHWWVAIEFWTKEEVELAEKHAQEMKEMIEAWKKEVEEDSKKLEKKQTKKKSAKKKSE